MGCTSSKPVILDFFEPGAKEFEMLKLTDDDICKLRRTFNEIVSPKEGTITVMTLLQYVETPVSMFADRVFAMFFCSSTRELDFRAFVLNVWNCCTFSRFNIGKMSVQDSNNFIDFLLISQLLHIYRAVSFRLV